MSTWGPIVEIQRKNNQSISQPNSTYEPLAEHKNKFSDLPNKNQNSSAAGGWQCHTMSAPRTRFLGNWGNQVARQLIR